MSNGSISEILASEWTSYTKASSVSLIEKSLKMSQILETPELDIADYMDKIHEDSLQYGYSTDVLRRAGYTVVKKDSVGVTLLDHVMDVRRGSALSLSIIHQHMALQNGIHTVIVSGESKPLIRGKNFCVDVMGNPASCTDASSKLLEIHIMGQMLAVLKKMYIGVAQYEQAMMCIDMAAGIGASSPTDHRDIGLILYRTGSKRAVWWLKKYLRENPDADDSAIVASLVDFLDTD